ncbi:hypothetical protein E4U41_007247 [Claviceps citrina]|nr:hypothetical protein E4U41_007247 [Claviceps citrina]
MALHTQKSRGTAPPALSSTGQVLPRRSSPEKSVTLNHHRLTREASLRASSGSTPTHNSNITSSPRRNSSGDSHETGHSDPERWFDQSNENPTATFDHATMDVDPPFFQKESDSSNEDKPYIYQHPQSQPRLATGHSSSADDYRSVIDDLTVEIQKLKEELKKYKQRGPDMLRKDKLFEIKYHGLAKRKRRELESTLRDFAGSIEGSPDVSSPRQKKSLRQSNRDHMYSGSGAASKHASSSSGSNNRPIDSAYASMSSGANSTGIFPGRSAANSRAKNDQKVESYLRDIPEGLYPRHIILTDRERKKLVVRRLEQLFTGKFGGRHARRSRQKLNEHGMLVPGIDSELQSGYPREQQTTAPTGPEPCREAKILPQIQQSGTLEKKSGSRDNASTSISNGDQAESGGNVTGSSLGTNVSPTQPPGAEQRPTSVKDLDPDRVQVPSDNMEYIRHLGLVPPALLADSHKDVQPDADGWVYLNLLCNLAQLHIVNVTPSFVRSAVNEISTKFQLSADGRKIRWRGGSEGTRFSSDDSNDSSRTTPNSREEELANVGGSCKRQKTGNSSGYEFQSGERSKSRSKFGPQVSASSDGFHYKPLFAHNSSPDGEISMDDTLSSFGPIDDSNIDESRAGLSGSGTSNRRRRRRDGAIIYYSGAPFCTDLSGDSGDVSPATYMLSSGQDRQERRPSLERPMAFRSTSGSCLTFRPLAAWKQGRDTDLKMDVDDVENVPDLATDSESETGSIENEFPWSTGQQFIEFIPLEPCGLGGVVPDDHFMVVVTTKRHKDEPPLEQPSTRRGKPEEATELIIGRLASMSTSTPVPKSGFRQEAPVEIEYLSGRIKRLPPVSLPPPAIFLPPFSSDSSSSEDDDSDSDGLEDGGVESSAELMSRQANPHQSDGYPDGVDLSSGDEDGEDPDEDSERLKMYDGVDTGGNPGSTKHSNRESMASAKASPGSLRHRSMSASADAVFRTGASSAATAGGFRSSHRPAATANEQHSNSLGAGAAGSSAAYHLRKYAEQEGLVLNVTLFEKTDHIGGRTLTVNPFDDPEQRVELGASIFIKDNHILYNASQKFGLELADLTASEPGDYTAIWDGEAIVFRSENGSPWWWDAARLLLRYGLAPYRATRLVKESVATFLQLYEEPHFPFPCLTQRAFELGLLRLTGVTGEQLLRERKVSADFVRELMQPATRVNYASNMAFIHGLEAMVSFATEGAVAVSGGNFQIFEKLVQHSGAAYRPNTTVSAIAFQKGTNQPGTASTKYVLSTRATRSQAEALVAVEEEEEEEETAFDKVIIASPWQYSGIEAGEGVITHGIDPVPYMKLHVTLFASPSRLQGSYFGLKPGALAPTNVYTTLGKDEAARAGPRGVGRAGFYSVSLLRRVTNPRTQGREYLYKIFSAEAVNSTLLSALLGADVDVDVAASSPSSIVGSSEPGRDDAADAAAAAAAGPPISWYCPHWFYAYPVELPRVTFQDAVVGRGVYYTSGMESFISTMETSALMGMNVARLVADDLAERGQGGGAAEAVGEGGRPGRPEGARGDSWDGMDVLGADEL